MNRGWGPGPPSSLSVKFQGLQGLRLSTPPLPRWLLEVNASPSLTASSQEDYELKTCLLEDTLHIVDMEAR